MANKDDVVIVSAVRTPFGRYGGSLREIDYYDLGAIPMREVLSRVKVSPDVVEEVFWGVGDTSPCKDPYTPVAARQDFARRRRLFPLIWLVYLRCTRSSWRLCPSGWGK